MRLTTAAHLPFNETYTPPLLPSAYGIGALISSRHTVASIIKVTIIGSRHTAATITRVTIISAYISSTSNIIIQMRLAEDSS